jgi:hypothetical protein
MAAGGAVDVGIGHVVSAGTEMCVQQGVHQAAQHTASETFGPAVTHPVDFASGIEYGVGRAPLKLLRSSTPETWRRTRQWQSWVMQFRWTSAPQHP